MKRLVVFSFAILVSSFAGAQSVKTAKKENRVKGTQAIGYSIELNGQADEVENALNKFLKEYGKTRVSSSYITVLSPAIGGSVYEGNALYATVSGDDTKSQVWIGLDTTEWRGRDIERVMDRVEKLTYQFGVKFYRDGVQKEIDLSQQALDATEKQIVRLTNQNKDLNTRLLNNEQDKIRLEKSLELNKLDHAVLLQKIENNKNSQDSVANAGAQIKKVLEAQKEKQRKIN